VKLGCFGKNQDIGCPHSAADVLFIAPDDVRNDLKHAHITYKYYPQSNDYTLIVRDNNYQYHNYRVALFDSRLPKLKNYGYSGLDLFDADIVTDCRGNFKITNPPALAGPWDRIN